MNLWSNLQKTKPTPLQAIFDKKWASKGVRLYIKRDDMLAPTQGDPFCGNKWRKLKYNLLAAKEQGIQRLLSFGGAYSNHIAALASAGHLLNFKTVGIIRGEDVSNHTLDRARADGMELHFIDRTTYRNKNELSFLADLQETFGPCLIIPEGGTNQLALKGCADLVEEIFNQSIKKPTHIAVSCGTGGTLAGIISGLKGQCQALGVSVLKGDFMTKEVNALLDEFTEKSQSNWHIEEGYHHGGYAKKTDELLSFIDVFHEKNNILLEPIYTGKLFYALSQLLEKGFFAKGSIVVAVHTGGLQGLSQ